MKTHLLSVITLICLLMATGAEAQRSRRGSARPDRGPAAGSPAPEFTLDVLSSDETVTLSRAAADRPVVLLFGSFT